MQHSTEDIVMARVRRIHRIHLTFSGRLLKASGILLPLALCSIVSLSNVVANMPPLTTPIAFGGFMIGALLHTEFTVQVLFIGSCIAFFLLARDVVRAWRQSMPFFWAVRESGTTR